MIGTGGLEGPAAGVPSRFSLRSAAPGPASPPDAASALLSSCPPCLFPYNPYRALASAGPASRAASRPRPSMAVPAEVGQVRRPARVGAAYRAPLTLAPPPPPAPLPDGSLPTPPTPQLLRTHGRAPDLPKPFLRPAVPRRILKPAA